MFGIALKAENLWKLKSRKLIVYVSMGGGLRTASLLMYMEVHIIKQRKDGI